MGYVYNPSHTNSRRKDDSNLFGLALDFLQHSLVSRLAESTLESFWFIIVISLAEPFRTKVEGIAEWFMNTVQMVALGHKDLLFGAHGLVPRVPCIFEDGMN